MPERASENSYAHYVVGLLLGVTGLLVILIFVSLRSQADDSTGTASVSNATPSIDSITVNTTTSGASVLSTSTPFVLNENATRTLYIYGTITDGNGCQDFQTLSMGNSLAPQNGVGNIEVIAYRSGVSTTCMSDGNVFINDRYCYDASYNTYAPSYNVSTTFGSACSLSGCSASTTVTANYSCSVPIRHFVDATDSSSAFDSQYWQVMVLAQDNAGSMDIDYSSAFDISTQTAIDVTANIAYGSIALGATSSKQTVTITNTGNNNTTTVRVYGTTMTCVNGTIGVAQQAYTTSSSALPNTSLGLVSASSTLGLNIRKQAVSTTAVTSNTYWMLTMPSAGGQGSSTGLSGTCTGTVSFIAS